jgi:hypothetical protein
MTKIILLSFSLSLSLFSQDIKVSYLLKSTAYVSLIHLDQSTKSDSASVEMREEIIYSTDINFKVNPLSSLAKETMRKRSNILLRLICISGFDPKKTSLNEHTIFEEQLIPYEKGLFDISVGNDSVKINIDQILSFKSWLTLQR